MGLVVTRQERRWDSGGEDVTWREGFFSNPPLDVSPPSGARWAEGLWGLEQEAEQLAESRLSQGPVWEMSLLSTSGLCLLWHHFLPLARIWRQKLQTFADWMWHRPNKKHLHSGPLCSGCGGIQEAGDHPHCPLSLRAWIPAIFKRQPHVLCSSEVALSPLCLLSLLFHGKLTLRLCFHFWSTHWLIQIPCDSKHSWYPLRISTKFSHRSPTKSWEKGTWAKNGLKQPAVEAIWGLLRYKQCPH